MDFLTDLRRELQWQRLKPKLKVGALCLAIAIAWGLLTLPVVFFHLPNDSEMDVTAGDGVNRTGANASGQSSGNSSSDDPDNSNTTTTSEGSNRMMLRNCSTIQCSDGFHCIQLDASLNISICRPRCDTWQQYPDSVQAARDALSITGGVIGLIAGITALIITGIRWKQVLTFPSVISVYMNITIVIYACLNLISFVDKPALYCTSTDLQESLNDLSFFCTFSGVLLHYLVMQSVYFWIFHMTALFFIVTFPVQGRAFLKSNILKIVHLAVVLAGLILPAFTVIVIATTGGFIFGGFPPQFCAGRDPNALFYSFLLPIVVISQIGTTLLLILFYIIHEKHGIFQPKNSKNPFRISTAEKKILIAFCYYLLASSIGIVSYAVVRRNSPNFSREIREYFQCEAQGVNPSMPCDRDYLEFTYPQLLAVTSMLYELFPVCNLIYVVNFAQLKQFCCHITHNHSVQTNVSKIDM